MYFTPDGRYAITVAEILKRLDFRDAHTMALVRSVPLQDRSTKRPGCLEPPQRKRCDAERHRKTKALLTANPA